MPSITPETTLGDLVTEDPARTRILESFGLDYCCGGNRPLAAAAAAEGVSLAEVIAALESGPASSPPEWSSMDIPGLAGHIESTHHAFAWSEYPRMTALIDKVAGVHGANHPELARVRQDFAELREDVEPHLRREEIDLFPVFGDLDPEMDVAVKDRLILQVEAMIAEHDRAGELLADLREITGGFTPPEDACASYTAMLAGLEEIETDLHMHVHKENNVLFPRVIAVLDD
ncbi:iron-sulfur cluster repair di-iron protein [Rhodococcus sp. D2-41]|uniref:Iron-sulfur cluster repair di-iron protein n=1 Tax=Speluncibacter jeojiensis TaxID=2710754 RepID=A0A9X4M243_9ACTN|nr:iron-sulfur cluster repair di-iron protein [Rhodococcus sp. D2-41]MDG3012759.1 iron-sulfur cluster repair di-iron protein [Rhodococcus sp. D2-41]MDG3015434.1 iron-sulfur cluster repair di-iron protein [Corynebacteriales bacterium D3-21]